MCMNGLPFVLPLSQPPPLFLRASNLARWTEDRGRLPPGRDGLSGEGSESERSGGREAEAEQSRAGLKGFSGP